jgi:hypothetical protein
MPQPKLYVFSTTIGAAGTRQVRTFVDLAEKLKMDVERSRVFCGTGILRYFAGRYFAGRTE